MTIFIGSYLKKTTDTHVFVNFQAAHIELFCDESQSVWRYRRWVGLSTARRDP